MSGRRAALAAALVLACCAVTAPGRGGAQALVADMSSHLVAITTGFTGTEVVVFGSIEPPGDVVVVVAGPSGSEAVRRKERVAGIWVNTQGVVFTHVPQFYAVAASRPLDGLLPPSVALRHEIGLDYLRLSVLDPGGAGPQELADFRAALIRTKQSRELYPTQVGRVAFLGQRLFRTTLSLPAGVPTGLYSVNVYLLRHGDVVSAQTMPLAISKIGFSADVYDFAQRDGLLYGLIGVSLAVAAGWGAGTVFRKG